jgi:hypothetical protein
MQRRVQTAIAALIGLAAMSGCLAWAGGQDPAPPPAKARVVNITSDSAPGWLPSPDQARASTDAAFAYLAAKDAGRAEAAYALLEEGDRAMQPFAEFSQALTAFNKRAGQVRERRVINVTWTKDPAQAPKPGVYAAIDFVSRFANVDRDCGYLVVYQPPAGGHFRIAREEENLMTNADAAVIERQHSAAAVESAWAQLASRCPNYPGDALAGASAPTATGAPQPPLPEQANGSIGYTTVAAALNDLRAHPGIVFRTQGGYTIADDNAAKTIWVFTSEGQPAYPAAIKRAIVTNTQGGTSLETSVLCEASKTACDDVVRTFEALNARMTAELRGAK